MPYDPALGNADAGPEGQDWNKGDFWDLPTDPAIFYDYVLNRDPEYWRHFQTTPVFQAMPPALFKAVDRLFGNRVTRAVDARRASLR